MTRICSITRLKPYYTKQRHKKRLAGACSTIHTPPYLIVRDFIMKLIDKLLYSAMPQGERLTMAFITLDEISGLYVADCRLWDGVAGSGGRSVISKHKTEQGAQKAIQRISEQYPNQRGAVTIFDDMLLSG